MADIEMPRARKSGPARRLVGGAGGLIGWFRRRLAGLYHRLWAFFAGLSGRGWWLLLGGLITAVGLYYLVGMAIIHRVDDDPAFTPASVPDGGSRAVAMTAALVERELAHGWIKNDPVFYASAPLDNMPNFQSGLFDALARFSFELRDQLGRNRGSSAADPDLEEAAGNLSKEGGAWMMKLPSPLPQTPSETYFNRAVDGLRRYNDRVAAGDAVFDKRSDNFLQTLDRIALDLGSASASIDDAMTTRAGGIGIDYQSDDLFFRTKGKLYGYYQILRALETDFASVIQARELGPVYTDMLESLRRAIVLDPLVMVMNGAPDGTLFPNHLAAQGFHLLRARAKLRELTNILQK